MHVMDVPRPGWPVFERKERPEDDEDPVLMVTCPGQPGTLVDIGEFLLLVEIRFRVTLDAIVAPVGQPFLIYV